jgi:signal transduction histidine kinase
LRWGRALSLRARLVLIGAAGLALGLAVGGAVLVVALGLVLQRAVDEGSLQTANRVAALVDADNLPSSIPVVEARAAVVVQVINENGQVVAAAPGSDRLTSLLGPDELRRVRAGERFQLGGYRAGVLGNLRVLGVTAGQDDAQTVVVAAPVDEAQSSVRLLRAVLLIGFPLLLAVLAALAWRVVGLTLRPVEALRRGAEEITGAGAAGNLPVPDARDEVHRLAVTLNDMLARLEASRRRQRAFVADAAHELRSPLASMRTQLEVAQRLGPKADWPATAEDLLVDTERLSRLVDDLLLLARADDAGRTAQRRQPVEVTDLVRDLLARYADARILPELTTGDPVWTLADPDALRRILANLLDNAVRHASAQVTLAATVDGAEAVITVTDDGDGIPAEQRERVFDRFTRLDGARDRDSGGSGLGLAIVRELVRLHGGTVELSEARPGAAAPGVRAELRLPVAVDPATRAGCAVG